MIQKGNNIFEKTLPNITVIFKIIKPIKKRKQQKILTFNLSLGPTNVF
jgi:hypothetical protein